MINYINNIYKKGQGLYLLYGWFVIIAPFLITLIFLIDKFNTMMAGMLRRETDDLLFREHLGHSSYGLFYTQAFDIQAYRYEYSRLGLYGVAKSIRSVLFTMLIATLYNILLIPRVIVLLAVDSNFRKRISNTQESLKLIAGCTLHNIYLPLLVAFALTRIINNTAESILSELRCTHFKRNNSPEQNYADLLCRRLNGNMLGDLKEMKRDRITLRIGDDTANIIVQSLGLPVEYNTFAGSAWPMDNASAHAIVGAMQKITHLRLASIEDSASAVQIIANGLATNAFNLQKLHIDCLRTHGGRSLSGTPNPSEAEALGTISDSLQANSMLRVLTVDMRQINNDIANSIYAMIIKAKKLQEFSLNCNVINPAAMRTLAAALGKKNINSAITFAMVRHEDEDNLAMQSILNACEKIVGLRNIAFLGASESQQYNHQFLQDFYHFVNNSKTIVTARVRLHPAAKKALCDTLQTNYTLRRLHLCTSANSNTYIQDLATALKINTNTALNLLTIDWKEEADEHSALQDAVATINDYRTALNIGWAYFKSRKGSTLCDDSLEHIRSFLQPHKNMKMVYREF